MRHKKWHDWSLVGGHVEPDEKNDWARAAVRECNEELAPLRFGEDFTLLPLLDQPLRWGPLASRSASGEPTIYTAQVFALRFLRSPLECLGKLPAEEFRIVRESDLTEQQDSSNLTTRTLKRVDRSALAWDTALPSLPLEVQPLPA
ncbi:MAG TPA: NUDIX hydrolase [Kofleriaceae bacterium]|nr:NUDIX hydrolase [Kofleriaceae bacterium]